MTDTAGREARCSVTKEAVLDEQTLAKAIDVLLDVGRVQCRCGMWPLLDNWGNHRRRKTGRPHYPVSGQAAAIIAREYVRLLGPR